MLKDNRPRGYAAPEHLAPEERALWDRLIRSFTLDDPGSQELLLQACEARGRAREAREIIQREGSVYKDHNGNLKAHPACGTERSSQAAFCSAMRLLKLDLTGDKK